MQTKKKIMIGLSVFILLLAIILVVLYMKRGVSDESKEETIVGTVLEIKENNMLIRDETGAEYIVYLEADYNGEEIGTFPEGSIVRIWFSGDIAETYPMQVTAYRIEKDS
ncbi:MAG: YobA family protein [Clostridium sp.]|nr:YobA family protein [Clostridium sp.]